MDWTDDEDCFHYKMWSSRRGISVSSDLYYLLVKLPSFWYQKQGTFFLTWPMLEFELLRDVHKFFNNLQFSFYSLSSWELRLSHGFQNSCVLPWSCALPRTLILCASPRSRSLSQTSDRHLDSSLPLQGAFPFPRVILDVINCQVGSATVLAQNRIQQNHCEHSGP